MWLVTCATCISLLLFSISTNNVASAKRILMITIAPFYSHQTVIESFCSELNKRGHELIVITPHSMRNTSQSYTEIIIQEVNPKVENLLLNMNVWELSEIQMPITMTKISTEISIAIFNNSEVKKLYRHDSNETFDAVIVEAISSPSLFALAHRFNAPIIGEIIFVSIKYTRENKKNQKILK